MTTITLHHTGIKRFANSHDEQIKAAITNGLQGANKNISVYSVGTTNIHSFDRESPLHVFNHSAYRGDKSGNQFTIDGEHDVVLWGHAFTTNRMFLPYEGGVLIKDEEGNAAGQYFPDKSTLNIFVDLLSEPSDGKIAVLQKIFEQVYEVLADELTENSFKLSKRKEELYARTRVILEADFENSVRSEKERVEKHQEEATRFQQSLHHAYVNLQVAMKKYQALSEDKEGVIAKKLEQFTLVADYAKVENLELINGKIVVSTVPLLIHDPHNDKYYIGGRYNIEIDMCNSDVKFRGGAGNSGRRGYWTGNDPHPHVNGGSGSACLGNVGATIAELCSQSEFYALVLVAIGFLETVNVNDGAGEKVRNWPRATDEQIQAMRGV